MLFDQPIVNTYSQPVIQVIIKQEEKPKPKKTYTVQKGDTLTSISSHFNVPISRLWAANPQLTDPDLLEPNEQLNVPENTDVLKDRPMPVRVESTVSQEGFGQQTSAPSGRSSVSGWSFPYGYCTYFASQARPDLPVRGNAADWIAWANSSVPQKGAVTVNTSGYGHVAIVLDYNGSQVLVRHMNWAGFGVVSEDWIDRSYWSGYIL